jgi:acyl carrier protein
MKQFVDNTLSLANGNHISKKKSLFRSLTTGTDMEARRTFVRQTVDPTVRPQLRSKVKNSTEIIEFLMQLVSDQSGIPKDKISPTDSLPSYGFDSIAVVRAAQNLSDFLGTSVGAIDIFTASCISELADFLVNLLHKSGPQAANQPRSKLKNSKDIVDFLIQIVSVQTGISKDKISPSDSLPSYGFDSITVVRAAQKLSDDIFTASCIDELANFLENMVLKSQPLLEPDESCLAKDEASVIPMDAISSDLSVFATGTLQLLGLICVRFILLLPAYLASSMYSSMLSSVSLVKSSPLSYLSSLVMAPIAWISYVLFTSLSLFVLGKSFLQPNYVLTPDVELY